MDDRVTTRSSSPSPFRSPLAIRSIASEVYGARGRGTDACSGVQIAPPDVELPVVDAVLEVLAPPLVVLTKTPEVPVLDPPTTPPPDVPLLVGAGPVVLVAFSWAAVPPATTVRQQALRPNRPTMPRVTVLTLSTKPEDREMRVTRLRVIILAVASGTTPATAEGTPTGGAGGAIAGTGARVALAVVAAAGDGGAAAGEDVV